VFSEVLDDLIDFDIMGLSLSKGDTFLDIGANHGTYSLRAAKLVGPKGKVLAFEPQPRLAMIIKRTFTENGFSQARVYPLAVSSRAGLTKLYIPSTGSGMAGLFEGYSAVGDFDAIEVNTVRLDDFLETEDLPGKLFIKLDVEGSELTVLDGAKRLIQRHHPLILLEINPTSLVASGSSAGELLHRLRTLGYSQAAELEEWPDTLSLPALDCSRQRNVIVVPESQ
jgi:FkbM family methyltransferase